MSYRRKHIQPRIKGLRRNKNFLKRPLFWLFCMSIIFAGVIVYFVLFFPKFQVKEVQIRGNEKVGKSDAESIVWSALDEKLFDIGIFSLSSRSIFIADKKDIIEKTIKEFPVIESVQLRKDFPNILILKIKERQPSAIFCQNKGCFYIDQNGIIFEPVRDIPQDMTTLRSDYKEISIGEATFKAETMENIYKISKNLKDKFQLNVKEVFVSDPLIVKTSEDWSIYFDPDSNIDLQIIKMNSLLDGEITNEIREKLHYIYLQYKDRAYYK